MTPIWHDGPLDGLTGDEAAPVVWRVVDPGRGERGPLVAMLLGRLSGRAAASVRLARSPEGAPQILSPRGWYVSLSGRGAACLIGAATRPIAVDRETIDDASPLWDMMTSQEADTVRASPREDWPRQWLRRWTIKEAHAKLIGTPRRIAPEAIETRLIDPVHAAAHYRGMSRCWTRDDGDAIETVALWADAA